MIIEIRKEGSDQHLKENQNQKMFNNFSCIYYLQFSFGNHNLVYSNKIIMIDSKK